jgi:hsp33 protein
MENRLIDCLAYEGKVSIKCISSSNMVEEARRVHDLSPVASAALGRLLTITSIMGYETKTDKGSITNQIKGNGPLGMLTAVAESNGNVKGYVANPQVDIPLNKENGKLDVGTAVGKEGMLYIIKDLGMGKPYSGMTPIVSGEIAEDFTNYFATSEQTPSVIALGVLVDKNGIRAAGGYKLSLMPDATEEIIEKIEESLKNIEPISKMLDENKTLEEIAKTVTGDENIEVLEEIHPEYKCNCSKEKCEKGLIAIGKDELETIIKEEEKIEIVCNFCNKKYEFTREDLKKLIK